MRPEIHTFGKTQAQSQLCIEQSAGRLAGQDQNVAVEGCTNRLHC